MAFAISSINILKKFCRTHAETYAVMIDPGRRKHKACGRGSMRLFGYSKLVHMHYRTSNLTQATQQVVCRVSCAYLHLVCTGQLTLDTIRKWHGSSPRLRHKYCTTNHAALEVERAVLYNDTVLARRVHGRDRRSPECMHRYVMGRYFLPHSNALLCLFLAKRSPSDRPSSPSYFPIYKFRVQL